MQHKTLLLRIMQKRMIRMLGTAVVGWNRGRTPVRFQTVTNFPYIGEQEQQNVYLIIVFAIVYLFGRNNMEGQNTEWQSIHYDRES